MPIVYLDSASILGATVVVSLVGCFRRSLMSPGLGYSGCIGGHLGHGVFVSLFDQLSGALRIEIKERRSYGFARLKDTQIQPPQSNRVRGTGLNQSVVLVDQ